MGENYQRAASVGLAVLELGQFTSGLTYEHHLAAKAAIMLAARNNGAAIANRAARLRQRPMVS